MCVTKHPHQYRSQQCGRATAIISKKTWTRMRSLSTFALFLHPSMHHRVAQLSLLEQRWGHNKSINHLTVFRNVYFLTREAPVRTVGEVVLSHSCDRHTQEQLTAATRIKSRRRCRSRLENLGFLHSGTQQHSAEGKQRSCGAKHFRSLRSRASRTTAFNLKRFKLNSQL